MNPTQTPSLVMVLALVSPVAPSAAEDPRTGAGLIESCERFLAEDQGDWRWAWCAGTVYGVRDLVNALPPAGAPACPPVDASVEGVAELAVAYGRRHPERLAEPAVGLLLAALAEAFPCPGPSELDRLTPATRQLLVRGIQQRLSELGYATHPSGYLGEQTLAAVRAYRKDQRLEPAEGIDAALLDRLMLRSIPAMPRSAGKPKSAAVSTE